MDKINLGKLEELNNQYVVIYLFEKKLIEIE